MSTNNLSQEPSPVSGTAIVQEDVAFSSGGQRCAGWLFRPRAANPVPGVVLAHGIGGIKSAASPAFARLFAAEGFAALVFDYRNLGTSEGNPRGLIDVRRQQEDLGAATAFLREVDAVDPTRIALWGTSFGAGHVLSAAARDVDLAAAVIQNPFVDGRATAAANLRTAGVAKTVALAGLAVRDQVRHLRGRGPPIRGSTGWPWIRLPSFGGPYSDSTDREPPPGIVARVPKSDAGLDRATEVRRAIGAGGDRVPITSSGSPADPRRLRVQEVRVPCVPVRRRYR